MDDNIRVVLIEASEITRIGVRSILQGQNGIQLIGEAETGTQGLELIESTKPDIAIIDLCLPDMKGIDLIKNLKQNLELETKILILTISDHEDLVLSAFSAGADSYCKKDTSVELLITALQKTHEGNSWIDPAIAKIILQQINTTNGSTSQPLATGIRNSDALDTSQIKPLTNRELEVLELLIEGLNNTEIAASLNLKLGTIKTHVSNILYKLRTNDRTKAAVIAVSYGLVNPKFSWLNSLD